MRRMLFVLALIGCQAYAAPAPRQEKTAVSEWTLQMQDQPGAAWNQETTFRSDGTCESPQYGRGLWHANTDGDTLYFGERDNVNRYILVIDWSEMVGYVNGTRLRLRLGPKALD